MCLHVWVHTCCRLQVKVRGQLWHSTLFFYHVGSRDFEARVNCSLQQFGTSEKEPWQVLFLFLPLLLSNPDCSGFLRPVPKCVE